MLSVFHLDPIRGPPGAVRSVPPFADQPSSPTLHAARKRSADLALFERRDEDAFRLASEQSRDVRLPHRNEAPQMNVARQWKMPQKFRHYRTAGGVFLGRLFFSRRPFSAL
jgi:hypothetical protein